MQTQTFDITTAIAVYGAIIATLAFGLSLLLGIAELRRYRLRIKVTVSEGSMIDANGVAIEHLILVEALNIGSGKPTITGAGWLLDNRSKIQIIRSYFLIFPAELLERKKITIYFPCRWLGKLKDADHIVGAHFQDEIGNTWKCRIKKKKLDYWKNLQTKGWRID